MTNFFKKCLTKYKRTDGESQTNLTFYVIHIARFGKLFLVQIPLLGLQLVSIPCITVALLLIDKKEKKLPWVLRWCDNADQFVGRNPHTYYDLCENEGYFARLNWLAFRNPLNYLGYQMGFTWPTDKSKIKIIDYVPSETKVGDKTKAGFYYIEVEITNEKGKKHTYYEYYFVHQYGCNPKESFRYRLGWKIGDPNDYKGGERIQRVFVITPLKTFKPGVDAAKSMEEKPSTNRKSFCLTQ